MLTHTRQILGLASGISPFSIIQTKIERQSLKNCWSQLTGHFLGVMKGSTGVSSGPAGRTAGVGRVSGGGRVLRAEVAEGAASGTGLARRPDVNRRITESEAFMLMNKEVAAGNCADEV